MSSADGEVAHIDGQLIQNISQNNTHALPAEYKYLK